MYDLVCIDLYLKLLTTIPGDEQPFAEISNRIMWNNIAAEDSDMRKYEDSGHWDKKDFSNRLWEQN